MVRINKKLLVLLLVVALLLGAGGVVSLTQIGVGGTKLLTGEDVAEYNENVNKYSKLTELMDYIEENYYEPVDEAKLLEGTYKGLFEALDDPYSEYVQASGSEEFMSEMLGTFYGIGMTFMLNDNDCFEVVSTVIGSPADKAGIKTGDLVISVDDIPVKGQDSNEVRDRIRGDKGTTVILVLGKPDGTEYSVSLQRELIHDVTVESSMMEDDIGYIRISQFAENTYTEFMDALTAFEADNPVGLVIDLRYNGGGLVNVAMKIADELMDAGTAVYALDGKGEKTSYVTYKGRIQLPYVILVNEYTASASEMIAAGIQDNNEGLIVGTKTFGKGIIQESYERPDGSVVKLTILQYFSPSGKAIHKVGITPDYVVELPYDAEDDYQYNKAAELLLSGTDVLNPAGIQGEGIAKR